MISSLLSLALLLQLAPALEIRFIGNEAFQITDGKRTIMTDFPYRPGAFGYMSYDPEQVRPEGEVLLLVTHNHVDHFDPTLTIGRNWNIVAPDQITGRFMDLPALPLDSVIVWNDVRIYPVRTPHSNVEHYSYRVDWGGMSLFFVGDTEDPAGVLSQQDIDVLFITPWLWESVRGSDLTIDAKEVVIYHHRTGQKVQCSSCWVPRQGETRRFDLR